jgi:glycosyltransferase involved in cell wall biosynthesis
MSVVKLPGLSLVLPAHNESANLERHLPGIAAALAELADEYEVVVVDDGSSDGTADVARSMAQQIGLEIQVLRHEAQKGYGITLADGLRATRLEYTAMMDADGQFEARDIERLVPLLDQAGLAGGWRMSREDPFFRKIISGVYNFLVRQLFRLRVRDVNCALKLMRTEQLHSLRLQSRSAVINAELYWKFRRRGWGYAQGPVPHHPRLLGRRSGARLRPIARAIRDLALLRVTLLRHQDG